MSRKKESDNYLDEVQDDVQATGQGPAGESMDLARGSAESRSVSEVDVNEAAVDEEKLEETFPVAHQVEPTHVIFVPFENFEGRINQTDFEFQKDVPVKVTRDEANTWLEAKKGYVK